jgi:hypothetical protein
VKPLLSMRDALDELDLFGPILAGESWRAWRILLIAICGEPLRDDERPVFEILTGRPFEPSRRVDESWIVAGRRSGKTRAAAILASYFAALCDHSDALAPGERGTLPIMSASMWQAGKAKEYVDGIFNGVPALKEMVVGETAEALALSNGVDVVCRPANYRTARSMSAVAVVGDELAFWPSDETSRNPDKLILDAVRPALATTGGPLIVISSPYAQKGELWGAYKRDFGANGDPLILVAKAASRTLNPTLSARVVERARERDALAARSEYDAEFRSDIAGYVDAEVVEAAVSRGVVVRALIPKQQYIGFVDPSGGSSDSMTLAVAHRDGERYVLDLVLERRPPFSPDTVVSEFAATLKGYRIGHVTGDRYAGEWPREAFRRFGIEYQPCAKTKSELYSALLPLINSRRVDLLDDKALIGQLVNLERRVGWGGRDAIDHGPGARDDRINVVAGVLVSLNDTPPMTQKGFFDLIVCDLRKRAETAAEPNRDCARPADRQP